jgi:hypothetical protein
MENEDKNYSVGIYELRYSPESKKKANMPLFLARLENTNYLPSNDDRSGDKKIEKIPNLTIDKALEIIQKIEELGRRKINKKRFQSELSNILNQE